MASPVLTGRVWILYRSDLAAGRQHTCLIRRRPINKRRVGGENSCLYTVNKIMFTILQEQYDKAPRW